MFTLCRTNLYTNAGLEILYQIFILNLFSEKICHTYTNDIKLNDRKLFIRFYLFFVSLLYAFFCSNYARVLRLTGPFVQEYTPKAIALGL